MRATAGSIRFADGKHELTGRPSHAITALGVARTFQNQRLFNQMTVLENVLVGRHCRTRAGLAGILLALPAARAEKRRVHERGGGAAGALRRAAAAAGRTARRFAVLCQPPAPRDRSGAGDRAAPPASRRAGRRHEPDGDARADGRHPAHPRPRASTILLIEHDMKLVRGICDRVVALDHGVKIAEGAFETVRSHPAVLEAYLGRRAAHA